MGEGRAKGVWGRRKGFKGYIGLSLTLRRKDRKKYPLQIV